MGTMIDYLNWRGDLSFEESPFNEVDGLLLSNLAYVEFQSIVASPWEEQVITLKEASERFWETESERKILQEFSLIKMAPFYMRRMAETRRFAELKLMYYQNLLDEEQQSQFAALCMEVSPELYFVAFRGTDNTMIGWKENFHMCFEVVPAQRRAVTYLNLVAGKLRQRGDAHLILGGHSKGGNLAVYAAAKAKPSVQKQIRQIYNNDGPGFAKSILRSVGYERIRDKIRKYVPESSFIGMLLEQDRNYQVVSSRESGFRQHDPGSWRVFGTGFVTIPQRDRDSQLFDRTMHNWIYSLSPEERRQIVNLLFEWIAQAEIRTLNDLGGREGKKKRKLLRKQLQINPDYRQMLRQAGKQMMEEFSLSLSDMRRRKPL